MTRKLAGSCLVLPLAAWASFCCAETPPDPAACPPAPLPAPFFSSAALRLSLEDSVAICTVECAFVHSGQGPSEIRLPLPPGRLASQESPTQARISIPEEAATGDSPVWARVRLPGRGRHQIRFELHLLPIRTADGFRHVSIPHPGAPVCGLTLSSAEGLRLDESALPGVIRDGATLISAFHPSPQPLALRWRRMPSGSGTAQQSSRFDFTLRTGEVRGKLELQARFDTLPGSPTLRAALPDGCIVTSVESEGVAAWRMQERSLVLDLRDDACRELSLILHTVSPITAPNAGVELPLPRLDQARTAAGAFTLRNTGEHFIETCRIPNGFIARRAAGDDASATGPAPDLAYDFFSLDSGATASLSIFQPRSRLRPTISTSLSITENQATILRRIRLEADTSPAFSADLRLPADEAVASVRLIQGDGQTRIRRDSAGGMTLQWSRGLQPGVSAVLEVASGKPLLWNHGSSLLRVESPRLPEGPWSGTLSLQVSSTLLARPVGNPRLRPVPAPDLAPEVSAAWTHDGYDALQLQIGKRQPHRTATVISRVSPSLGGATMRGEIRIDPGESPLEQVELILDRANPESLRFRSPLVSGIRLTPDSQVIRAALHPPPAGPFSLPWEVALPAPAIQAVGAVRRATMELPHLRTPGMSLQLDRLEVFQEPFVSLQFEPQGFDPVSLAEPALENGAVMAAGFVATAPAPSLRVTCEESGATALPPWNVEGITLVSQVAASVPHRHRCHLVLSGLPVARSLPLTLPPQAVLLSVRLGDRFLVPFESSAHPREVLIPLPAGPDSLHLHLDYLTEEPAWESSGEATLTPPQLPYEALVRDCRWSLQLPPEYGYSDFSATGFLTPPTDPPITLQPLLALFRPERTSPQAPELSSVPALQFQGDFSPGAVSFRYLHGKRQIAVALLWMLGGIAGFFVFARERPLFVGVFGVLLLSFLPLSGLSPLRMPSDGLLLGWIAGGLAYAVFRFVRERRRWLRKPAPGLATLLLPALGASPPAASCGVPEPAPFHQSIHHVQAGAGELRVISKYWADSPGDRGDTPPFELGTVDLETLTINGLPIPAGCKSVRVKGAGPQIVEARYRLPFPPGSRSVAWRIPPAAASLLVFPRPPQKQEIEVDGHLPLALQPDGSLTAALGSADQIRLTFPEAPAPAPPPAQAVARAALGLFPTAKRLALDVVFEHPGRSLDRYSLELPREFRLLRAGGAQPCQALQIPEGSDFTRVDLMPGAPCQDRMAFSLEWEAPLPAQLASLACSPPVPRADRCETSLTVAIVPPLTGALRDSAHEPEEEPFLPETWKGAARIASAIRLPSPGATVWVDLRKPEDRGEINLSQLYVVDQGRADAYCLAHATSPFPWHSTGFFLHPGLQARSVSGPSLLDWDQAGERLLIQRKPGAEPWDSFLFSLSWDPASASGELPFPLLAAPDFLAGDTQSSVAAGPGFQVFHGRPAGTAPGAAYPFQLSPPLHLQARLDAISATDPPSPRFAPAPPSFRSQVLLAVSLEPHLAILNFHVDALPQDGTLDSLTISLPAHLPRIRWQGPLLREARVEHRGDSDLYTLTFRGPVHDLAVFRGFLSLPLPPSGLRLPLPAVSGAADQGRFFVVQSPGIPDLDFRPEGAREIPLSELPPWQDWPEHARAFTGTADTAGLVVTPKPAPDSPPPPYTGVLDLHLVTTLRKDGASSHRLLAWLVPPAAAILEVELPASSSLATARLNGTPAATRSLPRRTPESAAFGLALPASLSRWVPSLVEIEYHSVPANPPAPDGRRLDFQLEAPRFGTLPVAGTNWQVQTLDGFELRAPGGNLYPVKANEFRSGQYESLMNLARDLKSRLAQEEPSPRDARLARTRILDLTNLASSLWPDSAQPPPPAAEESEGLRRFAMESAADQPAEPEPAAPPSAQPKRELQGIRPGTASQPARAPAIPLGDKVSLDPQAAPWLARFQTTPPVPLPAPELGPLFPAAFPGDSGSQTGNQGKTLPPAFPSTIQVDLPPLSSALFFKKLKGDAQLRLTATPESDPAILVSWLWFGAALALLAGLERIFGRAGRHAPVRKR